MHRPQRQVQEFMLKVVEKPTSPATPAIRDGDLRARLIIEEAAETVAALVGGARAREILAEHAALPLDTARDTGGALYRKSLPRDPDLVLAVDGICDLVYVAYGAAEAIGIDVEPFFDVVHAANMKKTGAPKKGEPWKPGAKPPGWVSPDAEIQRLLREAAEAEGRRARHEGQLRLFDGDRLVIE